MKKLLLTAISFSFFTALSAQIISPEIKAGFGIDADLQNNYFKGIPTTGNDDWFTKNLTGSGISVIDTSGAASLLAGYNNNVASRYNTVIKNMRYPAFTEVNGRLLMDAVFVRDFHEDDSTIFAAGSNKNGQNPSVWSSPPAQSTPDKNEILDVFMHVRRAGLTAGDSLWMFGALSIENTTGNRYFDFEMYQSDITFDYSSRKFTDYGPDAGHTSWEINSAGNITKAGDIILTAQYGSAQLTFIEARIWVNKNTLSTIPANFSWSGQFDGASSSAQYGYASIVPKTNGDYYSGLQNDSNTWAGPFKLIRGDNSIADNFTARQFMEFSVNLTKLGLDPVTILGGSTCDKPFQKVLVKTRASTSFTAELKDFVAPFNFFKAPKADLFTAIPMFCGVNGVSNIKITNPIATSVYTWSTIGGRFADSTNKTSVFVDRAGTYIVHQQLRSTCPIYATDTLTILFDSTCGILANNPLNFTGRLSANKTILNWRVNAKENIDHYVVESSRDGIHFLPGEKVYARNMVYLSVTSPVENTGDAYVYYRLLIVDNATGYKYSDVVKIILNEKNNQVTLYPNPVKDAFFLKVSTATIDRMRVEIYDGTGKLMRALTYSVNARSSVASFTNMGAWHKGLYTVKILLGHQVVIKRIMIGI